MRRKWVVNCGIVISFNFQSSLIIPLIFVSFLRSSFLFIKGWCDIYDCHSLSLPIFTLYSSITTKEALAFIWISILEGSRLADWALFLSFKVSQYCHWNPTVSQGGWWKWLDVKVKGWLVSKSWKCATTHPNPGICVPLPVYKTDRQTRSGKDKVMVLSPGNILM